MEEEKKDIRVCGGDYDSAMHYDCLECKEVNCYFRKEENKFLYWAVLLVITAISILILIS